MRSNRNFEIASPRIVHPVTFREPRPWRWVLAGAVLLGLLPGVLPAADPAPVIRVGSKAFTESVILGEMLVGLAAETGARVEHRAELGGTQICWKALLAGEIDCYVEYTGTIQQEILGDQSGLTPDALAAALAQQGVAISRPLGFNNTYALGMLESVADRLSIRTVSDLVRSPELPRLTLRFSDEFLERPDGWRGLQQRYGFPEIPSRGIDHSLAYRGLVSGSHHVTDLYTTDAEIDLYSVRVLEDDRGYFPRYDAVILSRSALAERAPHVIRNLTRLEGRIDAAAMIRLNARAKRDRVDESVVAAEFLRDELNVTAASVSAPPSATLRIVKRMTGNLRQHLLLVGVSLTAAILVAIPLGILSYLKPRTGRVVLGAVGIIQTLPAMAVLVFTIPILGLGAGPAIFALFLYSLLPIVRNTVTGLTEIPASLKESAVVLGLSRLARLRLVELPLASASILAGIKTAAVINVGTATVGALVGAGGFGQPILTGIRLDDFSLILQGAVPAAVLALVVQGLFSLMERRLVSAGLRS